MTQAAVRLPLLDEVLADQKRLTAVERFAQRHEAEEGVAQAKYYRDLIPLSPPGKDQQYAFHVDLDRCTGCKACVAACHRMNGLDEDESWRSVGLLHGGTSNEPVQKTVTAACHHCLEPACASGCPVGAYEKDPETGIVRHLDDQCIGCQYCMLTCPYEVPQFNRRLGIVRKCDLCADRLSEGEAPACVQGCPNEAISIRLVDRENTVAEAQAEAFLPGAPSPAITLPTTTYATETPLPRNVLPADFYDVRPAAQHQPLVIMLVLTQLSVGAFAAETLLAGLDGTGAFAAMRPTQAALALASGLVALAASVLHLGRPAFAFRAVLGLRTSWLSREIVAFGAFAALAVLYAASLWGGWFEQWQSALAMSVVSVGAAAVFCSALLYHATRRRYWHLSATAFRFFMTTTVLGLGVSLWVLIALTGDGGGTLSGARTLVAVLLVAASMAKLAFEASVFLHLRDRQQGDLKRSAVLLVGPLASSTRARFALGAMGGLVVPALLWASGALVEPGSSATFFATAALGTLIAGEIFERRLFFSAVSAPRMPGGAG